MDFNFNKKIIAIVLYENKPGIEPAALSWATSIIPILLQAFTRILPARNTPVFMGLLKYFFVRLALSFKCF